MKWVRLALIGLRLDKGSKDAKMSRPVILNLMHDGSCFLYKRIQVIQNRVIHLHVETCFRVLITITVASTYALNEAPGPPCPSAL